MKYCQKYEVLKNTSLKRGLILDQFQPLLGRGRRVGASPGLQAGDRCALSAESSPQGHQIPSFPLSTPGTSLPAHDGDLVTLLVEIN